MLGHAPTYVWCWRRKDVMLCIVSLQEDTWLASYNTSCMIVYFSSIRVTDEDVEEVMADYRTLPVSVWPPAARKQKKSRGVKQLCCCSKHAEENACEREAEKINMIPNKTSAPEQCEDTTQTQCAVALEPSDEDQHTDQTSSDHWETSLKHLTVHNTDVYRMNTLPLSLLRKTSFLFISEPEEPWRSRGFFYTVNNI